MPAFLLASLLGLSGMPFLANADVQPHTIINGPSMPSDSTQMNWNGQSGHTHHGAPNQSSHHHNGFQQNGQFPMNNFPPFGQMPFGGGFPFGGSQQLPPQFPPQDMGMPQGFPQDEQFSQPQVGPDGSQAPDFSNSQQAPVQDSGSVSDSDEATQLEALVLQYSNDERAAQNLPPLASDPALASIARAHSTDMLQNNYFAHNDQSGCSPSCRLSAANYPWTTMGENIHMMVGYNYTVEEYAHKIVNDWMNSPEHRQNLLDPDFKVTGVGVAVSGTSIYTTTDYAAN